MTTTSLLIRDIRTLDGARADILIIGSRIAAIGPALAPPPGCAIEDGARRLALQIIWFYCIVLTKIKLEAIV